MAVLKIDLLDRANGEKTSKGYKFTRRATVTVTEGEEQSGRLDDAARIFEAMNATGVPEIGDSHPNVANCQLDKIVCVAIDPNYLVLDLIYKTWAPNWQVITVGQEDISMEASVIQTETSKSWSSGSPVSLTPVSYIYPTGATNPQKPQNDDGTENVLTAPFGADSEIPVVPLFIPAKVYTIRKRLAGISEATLEALNDAYQGHVNDASWRGYAARTWLCTGIAWRTTDRRDSYNIEIRFQFKFDTFDAEVTFKDPHSGKVPNDVFNQANAYRRDRIQREANFAQLLTDIG